MQLRLKLITMFTSFHPENNTLLHQAIAKSLTVGQLITYLQSFPINEIKKMALTFNNQNKLPIDLLEKTFLSAEEQHKIKKLLLRCMLPEDFKKISYPLIVEDVIKQYPFQDGRTICNLIIATLVLNTTREIILHSSTHPQMNEMIKQGSTADREINYKIVCMRIGNNFYSLKEKEKQSAVFYQKMAHVEKLHMGNCMEFSEYSYYLLIKNEYSFSAELFKIRKGDHHFVVLDRASGSDASNPKTWGPHAVICDAWTGKVYLANEISQHLKSYREVEIDLKLKNYTVPYSFNVLPFLNPAIHWPRKENVSLQNIQNSYGFRYVSPFFSSPVKLESKKRSGSTELKSFVPYENSYAKKLKQTTDVQSQGFAHDPVFIKNTVVV
jgi:hypothetical protein